MSFPRAAVKRFNDTESAGPAPGQYNLQGSEKSIGVIKFENCSQRFKSTESVHSDCEGPSKDFVVPAGLPSSATKRRLNFHGSAEKKAESKSDRSKSQSYGTKEKQAHEREIRKLLKQYSEKEHDLKNAREEVQRLQGKVAGLLKDKLLLEGQMTSSEKSMSVLKKKNDLLEAQCLKERNSKNIEIELKETQSALSSCKQKMEKDSVKLANMEADLEAAKSTVAALQDANVVLEKFNKEIEMHENDVTEQVSRLQGIADNLRHENGVLKDRLETSESTLKEIEDGFQDRLRGLVDKCMTECKEKCKEASDAMFELQERIEAANKNIESLNQTMAAIKEDRTRLSEENQRMESTITKLKHEGEQATQENMELAKKLEELSEEILSSKKQISFLNEQIVTLNKERESQSQDYDEKTLALSTERDNMKDQLEKEQQSNAELRNDLQKYENEVEEIKAEAGTALKERNEIQAKFQNVQAETVTLQNECEILMAKLKDNESENSTLSSRVNEVHQELEEYKNKAMDSDKRAREFESSCMYLEDSLKTTNLKLIEHKETIENLRQESKDTNAQQEAKLNEFTRRILDTQKKLNQKETELKASKDELLSVANSLEELNLTVKERNQDSEQEIQRLKEEKSSVEKDLSRTTEMLQEMQLQQKPEPSNDDVTREMAKWKHLYEELQEKIKPFKGQLDAYSAEKSMLLSETTAAQAEMTQLGRKYAELLGHHNQKQKIKHIVKIKEENLTLKQETHKLRTQVSSLQKQLLENRKPRFDPSKAFQHQKENTNPN